MKIVIALVLATASLAAQDAKPASQEREFRFNWPIGIEARVESERSRERTGAVTIAPQPLKIVQRMRVLAHPEGRLIQYDQFHVDEGITASAALTAVSEQVQNLLPSFIVAPDGQFIRVENVARLREAVEGLLAPFQKDQATMPAGIKELFERLTSESVLSQMAGQEWELLVGTWTELPLKPGKFDVRVEAPIPLLPGVKVPMDVSLAIIAFAPCTRGGASLECVDVEMRSSVDQDGMNNILSRLMRGMKDLEGMKYDRLDVVTVVRLRLESESMLPHSLSTVRTADMSIIEPGKGKVEVTQVDRRTSRFVYAAK